MDIYILFSPVLVCTVLLLLSSRRSHMYKTPRGPVEKIGKFSLQVSFELLFSELKIHITSRNSQTTDHFLYIEVCASLYSTSVQSFHSSPSPFLRPRNVGASLRVMFHVPYRNVQFSLSLALVQFAVPDLPQRPILVINGEGLNLWYPFFHWIKDNLKLFGSWGGYMDMVYSD